MSSFLRRWAPLAALALLLVPVQAWAAAKSFTLRNGDKLTGEVVSQDADAVELEHPVFGRVRIPTDQLKPAKRIPGLFGTGFLEGWERSVDLGVSGSEGNSPEANFRIGMKLFERTERRRWRIGGDYKLSFTDGETDDNNARLHGRRDWLFPGSRWFYTNATEYQYDQFEPWEHRVSIRTGPGYHILREGPLVLDGLLGVNLTYEFGDRNELRPELLLGFELSWDISEGQALTLSNHLLPQLDAQELRNVTRFEWKIRLLNSEHLSLLLGFDNEYDTAAEDDKLNLKYYSSLSYQY